jgi:hypothetical protein
MMLRQSPLVAKEMLSQVDLDLTLCCVISHPSIRTLVNNIPEIEDLRVSGYRGIENAYTCAKRQ